MPTAAPTPVSARLPAAAPPAEPGFWSQLWILAAPHRGRLARSAVAAVVVGVTVALQPLTIKWIVDLGILRGAAEGAPATLDERLRWSLIFVGLYLALSATRITVGLWGVRHMYYGLEEFVRDLRTRVFRHVQGLDFRFHDRVSSGELFNYIKGAPVESLKQFLTQVALSVPLNAVAAVVALSTLAYFDWLMTAITAGTVVLMVLIMRIARDSAKELSRDYMQTESLASKHVADLLQGSRAIKVHAVEDAAIDRFEREMDELRDRGARLAWATHKASGLAESMQYLGMALVFAAGAWSCLTRGMEVGTLFAFVASVNLLMGPLMAFLQLALVRAKAESGLERMVAILRTPDSTPDPEPARRIDAAAQPARARAAGLPAVAFDAVRFAYELDRPLFDGLCIEIPQGQSVALVGRSGSGKSTFVSLLLRQYDPQAGTIRLDGADLRDWSVKDLRSGFGVVPQDPFIFHASIADNVRLTRPSASEGEVARALELAHATEFVAALPEGARTVVGEGGCRLSGGQRQRLAIARAALAQPRLFVFDEATSALDNESEERIRRAMEELMRGRTTFVIAHRLSTVRNVDRVLVFERGRIIQDGGYAALAAQPGAFADLLATGATA